jgi:hypothetical protein
MKVAPEIYDAIQAAAAKYAVEPALIAAVIARESDWDPRAVDGATETYGLMQIHRRGAGAGYTPAQLLDITTNLDLGTAYLKANLEAFPDDLRTAISGYHQGTAGAQTYGWARTATYVEEVLALYERYRREGFEPARPASMASGIATEISRPNRREGLEPARPAPLKPTWRKIGGFEVAYAFLETWDRTGGALGPPRGPMAYSADKAIQDFERGVMVWTGDRIVIVGSG